MCGDRHADQRPQESGIAEQQSCWKMAARQKLLIAIKIVEQTA